MRLLSYGLGALGVLTSGFLGMLLGLRLTLWVTALGFLTILVVTLVATPLPHVRSIPTPIDIDADTDAEVVQALEAVTSAE